MKRKTFIRTCSAGCLGLSAFPALLQGCAGTRMISSPIEGEFLVVPLSSFEYVRKDETRYYPYLVVQNELLQYPVCVYRISDENYRALWMRCTHQGTELQVYGDRLQCPAHGSEFGNKGQVTHGPASEDLRTFPFNIAGDQLKISLA